MLSTTRPAADESSPYYARYIARVADHEDVVAVLRDQHDEVLALLGTISETRSEYRYAPGKWSVKEMIGHLSDSERIFAYRALRFARGDVAALPGFDENAYVPAMEADRRTLVDLAEEWSDVRRATLSLFRHLPEAAWTRDGIASEAPISVRALAYVIAGHVRHHLEVLQTRYLG